MNVVVATLCFRPNGTAEGLYSEAIDLGCLGQLKIQRATTIRFDHAAQLWRVSNRKRRCLHSSPSRSECLMWEWDYFRNRTVNK